MARCIERCHLPCCLSRVHVEEAGLGVGIELLVSREVGQARLLLPGLLTILRTVAMVRDEGEKESAKRTAYSGLHTELRPRSDVTALRSPAAIVTNVRNRQNFRRQGRTNPC